MVGSQRMMYSTLFGLRKNLAKVAAQAKAASEFAAQAKALATQFPSQATSSQAAWQAKAHPLSKKMPPRKENLAWTINSWS